MGFPLLINVMILSHIALRKFDLPWFLILPIGLLFVLIKQFLIMYIYNKMI